MTRILDISVSGVLLVTGVAFFAMTFGDAFDVPTFGGDVGPAFAPRIFLTIWIVLSGVTLIQAIRSGAPEESEVKLVQMVALVAIVCATGIAITKIGFVFATVPGFAVFCWTFQYRKPVPLVVLSVLAPLAIWALFTFGFELLLPRSPWFHQI